MNIGAILKCLLESAADFIVGGSVFQLQHDDLWERGSRVAALLLVRWPVRDLALCAAIAVVFASAADE